MSEWQPIETAPKDGTYIIITDGHCLPDVVTWQPELPAHGDYLARPAGWFRVIRSRVYKPTHWFKLPPQPVTPRARRKGKSK